MKEKRDIIFWIVYANILFEMVLPWGAFWYFGSADLTYAHYLIPGPALGTVGVITTLIAYVLGYFFSTYIKADQARKAAHTMIGVVATNVVAEGLLWLISGIRFEEWLMIAGTHMYTIVVLMVLFLAWRDRKALRIYKHIFTSAFRRWVYTACAIFSVLLFQLAALPVYLQKTEEPLFVLGLLIVWFGSIVVAIRQHVRRLRKTKD